MAVTKAVEFAALMPDASQLLSEEPEMESSLRFAQLALLVAVLEWWWRDRQDFFIGANLSVYFSTEQEATRAEQEARRAEQLAAKLRELGVDPDRL